MANAGERQEPLDIDLSPDPVIEAYKPGVDITLLRENLKRTPSERLAQLEAMAALTAEFAEARRQRKLQQ